MAPPFAYDSQHAQDVLSKTSSVLSSLSGASVFITGATGFVGKVLVEKLLRSVKEIGGIYLLIRPSKHGKSVEDRLRDEIVASEVFTRLRHEIGDEQFEALAKSKLKAISGDLAQDTLGINEADLHELQEKVEVVWHVAASIDFNMRLDKAVNINVFGALRVLELCKRCVNVRSFVHTSTAYVNSNRVGSVEERLYAAPMDVNEVLKNVSSMREEELEVASVRGSDVLGRWPNTYTFTKFLAEHMLEQQKGGVPLAIVRPSIIGSAWQEPVRGWVDCGSAAGAVYLAARYGIIQSLPGDPSINGDIVPVDFVVNTLVLAVPAVSRHPEKFMVCHAALSSMKPTRWGLTSEAFLSVWERYPSEKAIAKPAFVFQPNDLLHQSHWFLRFTVPSLFLNVLSLTGSSAHKEKDQKFQKLIRKANKLVDVFRFFTSNEWIFDASNTTSLLNGLPMNEREVFWLSVENLDVSQYQRDYCYGLLKYFLKEENISEIDDLPQCNRKSQRAVSVAA